MNILVRIEGGLGDCLLANRFLRAIEDKHCDSNIRILFDTDGNPKQEIVMKTLWPSSYGNTKTLLPRKDKNYKINTLLGDETYPAHLSNMHDEFWIEHNKADKFYDLHIDGLKWLTYDFDWLRYYYYFPRTDIQPTYQGALPSKYVMFHLFARPDSTHNLQRDKAHDIISRVSKEIQTVTICNKEYFDFYKGLDTILIDPTFIECFDIASKCEAFLGIDSGIRYIPYHSSKPTFVFSNFCRAPMQVHPAQLIRWLIYEKNVLPMNADSNDVSHIISNVLKDKVYALFPYIKSDIDNHIYNRRV